MQVMGALKIQERSFSIRLRFKLHHYRINRYNSSDVRESALRCFS